MAARQRSGAADKTNDGITGDEKVTITLASLM